MALRLKEHNLTLRPTPAALAVLAEQGYDADFGARPLRRIIQQKVEDPLSDRLLSGEFADGDSIEVDVYAGWRRGAEAGSAVPEPEPTL